MIMALFKIDIILEVFINRKNVHGLTEIRKTKCNTTLRLDKLKWHYILSKNTSNIANRKGHIKIIYSNSYDRPAIGKDTTVAIIY